MSPIALLACGSHVQGVLGAVLSALAYVSGAPLLNSGSAAPANPVVQPAPVFAEQNLVTGILSDTDVFVSLRYMRHNWLTAEGVQAAVVQQGGHDGHGLALYKSVDDGVTWTFEVDLLSKTDLISDGILLSDGSLLVVTSLASTGPVANVNFLRLNHDPGLAAWSVDSSTPAQVYSSSSNLRASRASIAQDSNGVLWCSFRLQDVAKATFTIRLYFSLDGGLSWQDSLNSFGTPNYNDAKGAKVLAAGNRIAVVYQDVQGDAGNPIRSKAWAFRNDSQPLQAAMFSAPIALMSATGGDPLGSHWSVAADLSGNLHLSYQDGTIKYVGCNAGSTAWGSPIGLSMVRGSYNTISVANLGDIYVFAQLENAKAVTVKRFSVSNQTWSGWFKFPSVPESGHLRMCTPERFANRLPMLYQVGLGPTYQLLYCLLDL